MQFEKWYPIDLLRPPTHAYDLGMILYTGDGDSVIVGAVVTRDGDPVTLAGTVQGYVILPDGSTPPAFSGTIDGNRVSVTLPETAMVLSGRITLAIRVINGEEKTVVLGATAMVRRTSSESAYDPDAVIPTWDQVLVKIGQMDDAAQACNEAAQAAQAVVSSSVRYDTAQTLTATQQAQARENIAAADEEDFEAVAYPLDVEMLTNAGEAVRVISGGLSGTGGDLNSGTRARTQYFRVQPGNRYLFSLNDAEFVVISAWEYTGTSGGSVIGRLDEAGYTKTRFAFTASGNFVRIAFGHADTSVAITDDDKDAILAALSLRSVDGGQIPINSATPVIVAQQGAAYICGTVTELTFTPSSSGLCEVVFVSGSTATVLTLPSTVRMPDWWTGVEANRTYDLMILNGTLAGVMSWAT